MERRLVLYKEFCDSSQDFDLVMDRGFFKPKAGSFVSLDDFEFKIKDNLSFSLNDIYIAEQIHSNKIARLDKSLSAMSLKACDALVTNIPNTFLAVKTADCFPVFFYDKTVKVIAVAHSGREGTRLDISKSVLEIFFNEYDSKPEDIFIEIGPGICGKHYPVSEDIYTGFYGNDFHYPTSDFFIDLEKSIVQSLLSNGVLSSNIISVSQCTFEKQNFYSYRRDRTSKRQLSLIGMVYV